MEKVRWGILSTAKIGREKVIPALQQGTYSEVTGIASRNKESAQAESERLRIPKAYDSYEALLEDEDIDAVYIPLPNHLHVPWTLKCIEAGKHVLCEKPIGLSSAEAERLIKAVIQKPQIKVMEAFMYRFHPQWQTTKRLVQQGKIGELKTIQSFFSYYNIDPLNIRNQKEAGGGGMMDIGCYCVSLSRFLFGEEPNRVLGWADYDPVLSTDRMASGILQFSAGTATFTCSTQLTPFQRVQVMGTKGRIEIEIPFNAPPDRTTRIGLYQPGHDEIIEFDPVDQFTLQGDAFSQAILTNSPVPTPLEDALNNMKVIEAVVRSAEENAWVHPFQVG